MKETHGSLGPFHRDQQIRMAGNQDALHRMLSLNNNKIHPDGVACFCLRHVLIETQKLSDQTSGTEDWGMSGLVATKGMIVGGRAA